jgi:uncharacterized Ntn-hydrolase superfamily protein
MAGFSPQRHGGNHENTNEGKHEKEGVEKELNRREQREQRRMGIIDLHSSPLIQISGDECP